MSEPWKHTHLSVKLISFILRATHRRFPVDGGEKLNIDKIVSKFYLFLIDFSSHLLAMLSRRWRIKIEEAKLS